MRCVGNLRMRFPAKDEWAGERLARGGYLRLETVRQPQYDLARRRALERDSRSFGSDGG